MRVGLKLVFVILFGVALQSCQPTAPGKPTVSPVSDCIPEGASCSSPSDKCCQSASTSAVTCQPAAKSSTGFGCQSDNCVAVNGDCEVHSNCCQYIIQGPNTPRARQTKAAAMVECNTHEKLGKKICQLNCLGDGQRGNERTQKCCKGAIIDGYCKDFGF